MPEQLRFDKRVAVVTGAGAGLGRAYALLLASRGASVVVNDLGGGRHGDGSSTKAADAVVNEIRAAGGKAVANYDSVEFGEKIIQTAIDNFGRVDILINNAGILRDKSFARISDTDWDLIQKVHLKGSFKTTQAAWPYFKKQNYGRIIMTSSTSGIYGNFGQANYSAAKMALIGLSNTLAIEGQKNNIFCNVIVPVAASRLTEDVLPPDLFNELKPELIAPVVAYLCHETCTDNGSIVETAAGWAGKCHVVQTKGDLLRAGITDTVTIENVRDCWQNVSNTDNSEKFANGQEVVGFLMNALGVLKENSAAGCKQIVDYYNYNMRDLILYALGVGCSVTDPDDMKYIYENHEEFAGLPTFLVLPGQMAFMLSNATDAIKIPGKTIDLSRLLHGEQYLEVYKDVPLSGRLESRCRVVDVLDKGKGAVAIINMETYDGSGDKVCFAQMAVFLVGCGGFNGPRNSKEAIEAVDPPKRKCDASIKQRTGIDQAALYRLSGDKNPLHIDSNMAAMGGFSKPILHGLSSFGYSVRHVIKQFANNDPKLFKAVKVRFAKPVYPGETLQTDMWREGNRIHFQTTVVENGSIVISGAYVDLHKVVPRDVSVSNVNASQPAGASSGGLKSDSVFNVIKSVIETDPSDAKNVNAVFLYNITKDGKIAKSWTVDCKKLEVYNGDPKAGKPDTTLTVSDDDFVDMASGKLNPQMAFMKGKLKIKGNIMLAEKMKTIMQKYKSKL
ncbi:UNVERIFIED_CONTAM: hypothetical protein PYX00_000330 [Menopon gallinae]